MIPEEIEMLTTEKFDKYSNNNSKRNVDNYQKPFLISERLYSQLMKFQEYVKNTENYQIPINNNFVEGEIENDEESMYLHIFLSIIHSLKQQLNYRSALLIMLEDLSCNEGGCSLEKSIIVAKKNHVLMSLINTLPMLILRDAEEGVPNALPVLDYLNIEKDELTYLTESEVEKYLEEMGIKECSTLDYCE